MGLRGPPKKDPKLESAQGFPRRRRRETEAALKAAQAAASQPEDDLQDEPLDSRFVQPPPYLTGKRQRAVWVEVMSGPNAQLWFKASDHSLLARYCDLTVAYRQISKVPPKATYVAPAIVKGEVVGELIKRNPAFDTWLALSRELRSIEERIAANPGARLNLERQGLAAGKGKPGQSATAPDDAANPPAKPRGPLGVLKAAHKH